MPVTDSFKTYVLEQLGRVRPDVRARAMFGGVGVYAGERIFGLIDDDILYLKVDDTNRGEFEKAGMGPFQPFGPGGEVMQYFELPEGIIDDPEALAPWVDGAVEVSARAKVRKKKPSATPKVSGRKKR